MLNDNPLVSIITPAYNAEQYIAEAIQSVLDQTYTHWELLIIDDGSTDNTASIIARFDDKRIKQIKQKNLGVSSARNKGLTLAQGQYITFLDSDDSLPLRSLELRARYLNDHLDTDAIHGAISIRDELLKVETKVYTPFAYENVIKKSLRLNNKMFFNPCYMVRYSKIQNIKFKNGMTHCEDMLFMITLFSRGLSYHSLNETTYCYRVSGSSAMSHLDGMIQGFFELVKNVMKIPSVTYKDTILMRVKIIRIMLSWYIRNKDISGLLRIVKVFF